MQLLKSGIDDPTVGSHTWGVLPVHKHVLWVYNSSACESIIVPITHPYPMGMFVLYFSYISLTCWYILSSINKLINSAQLLTHIRACNAVAGALDGVGSVFFPWRSHIVHGQQFFRQVREHKGHVSLCALIVGRGILRSFSIFERSDCQISPASSTGVVGNIATCVLVVYTPAHACYLYLV